MLKTVRETVNINHWWKPYIKTVRMVVNINYIKTVRMVVNINY